MTKQEIRQRYLNEVEDRIKAAESWAGDERFDKLHDVCMSSYGYTLFFPICGGFGSDHVFFDAFCELFSDAVLHCIDDDGNMCLVQVAVKGKLPGCGNDHVVVQTFVARGYEDELDKLQLLELAKMHGYKDYAFVSYVATNFDNDVIDFLHGLLPEWERIALLGKKDASEAHSYFEERRKMEAKFLKFIENRKEK